MKRSIIWTTAGIAAIGFAVPAFAANGNSSKPTVPASVTVTANTAKNSGTDSARDIIENAAVTPASVTPAVAVTPVASVDDTATANSVDDDATTNSVEDATDNSVDDNEADDDDATEDVSGNCDEAEHANDPSCTGAAAADDNSGHDGNDDSGHGSDD